LQDVIESQIYPPLSNGFSDENAYIRELTLKALLTLAPKMKQGTLTSNLLKHLSRLQVRRATRAFGVLGRSFVRMTRTAAMHMSV
jgi:hypothetical protein